ncbi:uncharacterized protein LOC114480436 [Gouania willdenowi]|uniref:Uncharacterized LOC114480436 n=1 Tax=Gouania willdenowi TaxID=441366 RepID=A0A8C5GBL1_GOUWI|nr:uncharacterized protein LOC114480436 [Gouania willdenowi]
MGCRCCRMIKSYIYDPSVAVDGRKTDSAGNSLYQHHHYPGGVSHSDPPKQKEGLQNLGYSKSNDSTLKLEADKNQVNHKLHSASVPVKESHRQASAPSGEPGLYIIQPQDVGPRWVVHDIGPSQVPIYPNIEQYHGHTVDPPDWDGSITKCKITTKSLSVDEIDEGVGGTPEYPCDTGDEGSVLSVDIHTSTTSLSSADTKDEIKTPDVSTLESGISVAKSEEEEEEVELRSVTDSMVAEALAELEAATAGEESE